MGRRRRSQVFFFFFFFLQLQLALLILATSTTTTTITADGSSHANAHAAVAEVQEGQHKGSGVESMMLRKTMLGSRPPSCEGRCRSSCGRRCEAVQVPVTPHDLLLMLRDKRKKETLREAGAGGGRNNGGGGVPLRPSSYDDHSNYKPLGWRCKCLHS